jgi:hypothetical protein
MRARRRGRRVFHVFVPSDSGSARGGRQLTNYPVSNVYRYESLGMAESSESSTMGWTRRWYDTSRRLVEEATFSSAALPAVGDYSNLTGKTTISYSNNCRTFQDRAYNSPATGNPRSRREICEDAADRTLSVTEWNDDSTVRPGAGTRRSRPPRRRTPCPSRPRPSPASTDTDYCRCASRSRFRWSKAKSSRQRVRSAQAGDGVIGCPPLRARGADGAPNPASAIAPAAVCKLASRGMQRTKHAVRRSQRGKSLYAALGNAR